jgi:hypothetical protein
MTALGMRLTEWIVPRVFVLSLPPAALPARYDHARSLGVLRVVLRAVSAFYREARTGARPRKRGPAQ